ncbi:hypothetical protein KKJ17_07575 [Xenorhabdus bovienii]|uniref:Uncharacterized protein n=2 Tax=Xenorhabdus bovienii TaxID=40576 RepID=A0A077PJQ2_XENBV|nr:hypothetical protein [Xenorhabdus bovienii]MDE9455749.1 hypothetical protein [Xenorhabdus bovienii]MDE9517606.1 hypothetical protein [Xenorhabdus bovienii]MDE9565498.1 hypothetical protein [Xenorhabdus bovienii]CDH06571.1 conserved hypothetical protein [Xenorhabdus bovienii str. oregonense]CDH19944.1 conserved hypothetical protein [Xenorhabdus bovienii str. kraussei Quebec]
MIQIPTPVELNKGRIKFGTLLIRPLRKSVVCSIPRYQVEDGSYCYGKFDSRERALDFCEQLYGGQNKWTD